MRVKEEEKERIREGNRKEREIERTVEEREKWKEIYEVIRRKIVISMECEHLLHLRATVRHIQSKSG